MTWPAVAVLIVQAIAVGWFCVMGSWAGSIARPSVGALGAIRVALWTGLLLTVTLTVAIGLMVPLRGSAALVALTAATVLAAGAWALLRWRRGAVASDGPILTRSVWVIVPVMVLLAVSAVVAHLAFGPVDNYDTGLYHLDAIRYAEEYPTIHGLANLHTRLGTNVSGFSLAALGANTPFGPEAFRLLVGVFLLVLFVDVALRLLDGRPGSWRRPGTFILVLVLTAAIPNLLTMGGATITSPSPDTLALVASVAAGAYLVDAVVTGDRAWSAVALIAAALAASVRTQLWVTFAVTVLVLGLVALRDRARARGPLALPIAAVVLAALTAVVMLVRDTLLSGWLLFPATYLPMPVDWRVPATAATSTRDWILSFARDASAGPDQTLTSWYWLGSWLRATMTQWSVTAALGFLALAVLVFLAIRRRARPDADADAIVSGRRLLLAWTPAAVTVVVWFWTAPDPRFAWGALLLVGAIPAAFALQRLHVTVSVDTLQPIPLMAAGLLTVVAVPAVVGQIAQITGDPGGASGTSIRMFAFGPVDVVAAVSTIPAPATKPLQVADGRTVVKPVDSERCWAVAPACTPYQDATLRFRGPTLADGFTSGP